MSYDELLTRASGRARFCRDKGGVKTPDLLDQLSARIREQDTAIAELVEALEYVSRCDHHKCGFCKDVIRATGNNEAK